MLYSVWAEGYNAPPLPAPSSPLHLSIGLTCPALGPARFSAAALTPYFLESTTAWSSLTSEAWKMVLRDLITLSCAVREATLVRGGGGRIAGGGDLETWTLAGGFVSGLAGGMSSRRILTGGTWGPSPRRAAGARAVCPRGGLLPT
jgi:hypothetical protein